MAQRHQARSGQEFYFRDDIVGQRYTKRQSVFFQDTATYKKLTVNFGLRWDKNSWGWEDVSGSARCALERRRQQRSLGTLVHRPGCQGGHRAGDNQRHFAPPLGSPTT